MLPENPSIYICRRIPVDVVVHPRNLNFVFVAYGGTTSDEIFLVRLWLTLLLYRWNCVLRSCNAVIEPVDEDINEGLSQKERKTLQTYELLIPAGAPGGSGYTDPVTLLFVPLETEES